MRSRSTSVFNYPGLDEVIEESNAHIIENKLRQLKHRCSPKTIVEAYCRYRNCLQYHISTDIVQDDPEFKGYVAISCTERCVITFHSLCWRKVREEDVDLQASDKEHLGEICITDGCHGVIKAIKHYEGLGRPKIITQSEPLMEPPVKKDARPSKLNRTKPSSSKKLARISQRHQEKVAEWHLRKEQEKIATQSSYEDSVTTQTSVESVNELHNATTTPNNREDAGTPGDMRKGGLEVRVGKESVEDDAETKLKNKMKKRTKVKQREKEIVLIGFISEHTGISGNAEIDESGNVQQTNLVLTCVMF